MMRRTAGFILAGAVSTSAFLLPPGITVSTESFTNALAAPFAEGLHVPFALPCPNCAFGATQDKIESSTDGEDMVWIQGGAHDLLLNLTISEDGQRLELGGTPIYPLAYRPGSLSLDSTSIAQIPAGTAVKDLKPEEIIPLEVDSYGISSGEGQEVTPFGDSVEPLRFTIFALNGQYMNFGGASITLLRTSANTLMILDVQPLSPSTGHETAHRPEHLNGKECSILPAPLCRFKNMIESQFQALRHSAGRKHHRPCPGRLGGHHRGRPNAFADAEGNPMRHHGRPHHARPHHHDGHHHRHHRHSFFHAFTRGFLAVIVPILAGVAVGMSVSLLGLLISRLICFVWGSIRGTRRSRYDSVPQEDSYIYDGKIAVADTEELPVYEHAPPYEPVEKEQQQ